jgi:hypothetical protein
MADAQIQSGMRVDRLGAAHLVARILVWLGLGLAALGFVKTGLVVYEARSGVEATAVRVGGGGRVELSWQEPTGELRRAVDVGVSRALGRKLRIGNALWREKLRIRYRPGVASAARSVVVVDDVPEQVKSAAALAIAGFLAVSAGSFLILGLMLPGSLRGRSAGAGNAASAL